jgi:hypothetical protein
MTQIQDKSKACYDDVKATVAGINERREAMTTSNIAATLATEGNFAWSFNQINFIMRKLAQEYAGVKRDWVDDVTRPKNG